MEVNPLLHIALKISNLSAISSSLLMREDREEGADLPWAIMDEVIALFEDLNFDTENLNWEEIPSDVADHMKSILESAIKSGELKLMETTHDSLGRELSDPMHSVSPFGNKPLDEFSTKLLDKILKALS